MVDPLTKFKEIMSKITKYINDEEYLKLIIKCYKIADDSHSFQMRDSGEPYIMHPLAVIEILSEMKQDGVSICAGLLHDVIEDTKITDIELKKLLLENEVKTPELEKIVDEIIYLVNQVTKVKNENYEIKLIKGTMNDLRVIMVKLADRLHNMRTLQFKKDPIKRKKTALKTFNQFIPWAKGSGAYQIKYELEDLCFKEISPNIYKVLQDFRTGIKYKYQNNLDEIQKDIDHLFPNKSIYYVQNVKNVYGIYKSKYPQLEENENKKIITEAMLQDINVLNSVRSSYSDIKELVQLKIITKTESDCFQIASKLLEKYKDDKSVTSTIRNYIANSKKNLYRSFDFEIEGIQYQIRTEEMDLYNCYGWAYDAIEKSHIDLPFRQSLKKQLNGSISDEDILRKFQELATRKIKVIDGDGNTHMLDEGSTVADLAYKIDSGLLDAMNNVIVGNQSVRKNYVLQDGDLVFISIKTKDVKIKELKKEII